MTSAPSGGEWDAEFRPHRVTRFAYGIAALIASTGTMAAMFSAGTSTGALLGTADQFAMAGLAIVLAGAVLLLTRPRLRIGPAGLAVRNLLEYRFIPWSEVTGVSFPPGRRWARVDLAYNEYVPVLAVQVADRQRAVDAMDTIRDLMARYRPALG